MTRVSKGNRVCQTPEAERIPVTDENGNVKYISMHGFGRLWKYLKERKSKDQKKENNDDKK